MGKIFFVFLILLFSGTGLSQTIAITEDGRKVILKSDMTYEYVVPKSEIVNSKTTQIVGDNIQSVKEIVQKVGSKIDKSEFETEDEYFSRLDLLLSETKYNDKTLDNVVFVTSPDATYNAELKQFEVSLRQALRKTYSDNRLSIEKWQYGAFMADFDYIDSATIKMEPLEAREQKGNIALAVFGFPVGFRFGELRFVAVSFCLFNSKSQQIYFVSDAHPDPQDKDSNGAQQPNTSDFLKYNGPIGSRAILDEMVLMFGLIRERSQVTKLDNYS